MLIRTRTVALLLAVILLSMQATSVSSAPLQLATQRVFYDPFDDLELANDPTWQISIPQSPGDASTGELITHGAHVDGSDRYSSQYDVRNLNISAPDYLEISYDGRLIPFSQGALYQDGRGIILGIVGPQGRYDLNIQNGYTSGFPTDQNAFSIVYHSPGNFPRNLISSNSIGYPRPVDGVNYHVRAIRQNGAWSLYVDGTLIGSVTEPFQLTQITQVHLPVVGSIAIDNIQVIVGVPTEILDANINIYNIINGTSDGSSPDTFYGFEAFVRAQGDLSTFDASKVTLTVDGNPLNIDHAGISYDGEKYHINAGGAFGGIPPFGEYAITIEDADGQLSDPFVIGNLEDYPKDASDLLFPEHQSSIANTQPDFNWEAFNSDYLGQPIAPWAYEIDLGFPNGDQYFVFPIDESQTTLNFENPDWNPSQPPALEPGVYSLIVHSNHQVIPGFNFEHHRSIHFEVVPPNQPPTADAGPDQAVFEGDSATLDASASFDPDDNITLYEWDLNADGIYDVTGVITTTSFTQAGDHPVTLRVTDAGGLSDTDTATVTVLPWTLKGFYQPVDMNGVYNTVKGGSTVPLKFEIFAGSTELTDIAYIKSLTYAQTSCDTNAPTDEVETTATGDTSLRYADGQFIYNWKTPKSAGMCYRVTMTTIDGSTLMAYFKLK